MFIYLYGVEACPLLVRDRKSFDFTITRSFMKSFHTSSVTVVTDCQKFSLFYQSIDIRTVKFLQKFQSSDNHTCVFSKKAEIGVKNILSQFGSQIHNVYEYDLKKIIANTFFGKDP